MTAEPPSLLSPPPAVVRRVRARVLCLGGQVALGTPLRRVREHQRRGQGASATSITDQNRLQPQRPHGQAHPRPAHAVRGICDMSGGVRERRESNPDWSLLDIGRTRLTEELRAH